MPPDGARFVNGACACLIAEHAFVFCTYQYAGSRVGSPNLNLDRPAPGGVTLALLNTTGNFVTFTRGNKFFELSNHLDNVLVTLSDKKRGVQNGTTGSVRYYLPIVKGAQDYFPGGMQKGKKGLQGQMPFMEKIMQNLK